MEKLKTTQGEFKKYQSTTDVSETLKGVAFFAKNKREVGKAYGLTEEEAHANADLFVDSLITYNKCHKLPSELLEEVNIKAPAVALLKQNEKLLEENRELVEALKLIRNETVNLYNHCVDQYFIDPEDKTEGVLDMEKALYHTSALLTKIENKG